MTAYEFVSSMFQDLSWSERPEPMTTEDAAHQLRCSVEVDGLQIPDGLTPQLYSTLWNSFCLTDTPSQSYNSTDDMKGETAMTKQDAYITENSFGSDLPHNWERAASYLNDLIDQLPEDENGDIDPEDVRFIWESYCNGDYDSEI